MLRAYPPGRVVGVLLGGIARSASCVILDNGLRTVPSSALGLATTVYSNTQPLRLYLQSLLRKLGYPLSRAGVGCVRAVSSLMMPDASWEIRT